MPKSDSLNQFSISKGWFFSFEKEDAAKFHFAANSSVFFAEERFARSEELVLKIKSFVISSKSIEGPSYIFS